MKYRDEIKDQGLVGPFIVAYKNGNKITIKESLAIIKSE